MLLTHINESGYAKMVSVEEKMETLRVARAVAALTIYDMCKAIDKEMMIQNVYLLEKIGGKSGHYLRNQE